MPPKVRIAPRIQTEPGMLRSGTLRYIFDLATSRERISRNFLMEGLGDVITTGVKGYMNFDYNCVIKRVRLAADQSGSIVVDIWKDTYANFPPTVADTICASAKPTLSAAQTDEDTTLTGWTRHIAKGDLLAFNVDSASTVTRVLLSLELVRI